MKPANIRDPIHGYIGVAVYETPLLDHPITQRLRNIAQTGLAYLVFPEATTNRLAHSLGAMHLASRFLVSAIENARPEVGELFFDSLERSKAFQDNIKDIDLVRPLLAVQGEYRGVLASPHASLLQYPEDSRDKFRALLTLAEAALRLAALFHDVGHLPFSHDFEYALRDYLRHSDPNDETATTIGQFIGIEAPHEVIGHRIAELLLRVVSEQVAPEHRAPFHLVPSLLEPQIDDPGANALNWLHSIIDGEIDVDRADYLLRDARALGFEFASYDLERLIANFWLATDEGKLVSTVHEKGITSLESFLIARTRSTQVLVRHHKVSQIGAAFRHITSALLPSQGKEFLEAVASLAGMGPETDLKEAERQLVRFSSFDDGWWRECLRRGRSSLQEPLADACAALVLERAHTLTGLWKRKGEVGEELKQKFNTAVSLVRDDVSKLADFIDELAKEGLLLSTYSFKPYKSKKKQIGVDAPAEKGPSEESDAKATEDQISAFTVLSAQGLTPLSEVSPLVRSLWTSWLSEIHGHVFSIDGVGVTKESLIERIADITHARPGD